MATPLEPTRSFTYAGIAAYIDKLIASLESERQRYELHSISFIPELAQPVWVVKIDSHWEGTFTYTFTMYVSETTGYQGRPQLDMVGEREVPPGSSTVAEEDEAIAKLMAQRLEGLQRKSPHSEENAVQ